MTVIETGIVDMLTQLGVLIVCTACALVAFTIVVNRGRLRIEGWQNENENNGSRVMTVTEAYTRVLGRGPSQEELSAALSRLEQDSTFTTDTLEMSLVLSPERARAAATQTDALRTELEETSAREQTRKRVTALYVSETGEEPSARTESFLYKIFLESGMREDQLIRMIRAVSVAPQAGTSMPLGM